MKKLITLLVLLLCLINSSFSENYPEHKGFVNDFANIIPNDKEKNLNDKLRNYENKTSIEIAVVTVNTLAGYDISDYTISLAKNWGVGKKKMNNGLVILIAPNERKWRIEVGYGLEEWITDGYSKITAEKYFKIYFVNKDYYSGINLVVDDFISKLGVASIQQRQEYLKLKEERNQETASMIWNIFYWIIVVGLGTFILIYFVQKAEKKKKVKKQLIEEESQKEILRKKEYERTVERSKQLLVSLTNEYANLQNHIKKLSDKNFANSKEVLQKLTDFNPKLEIIKNISNPNDKIFKCNQTSEELKKVCSEIMLNEEIANYFYNFESSIEEKMNSLKNSIPKHQEIVNDINEEIPDFNWKNFDFKNFDKIIFSIISEIQKGVKSAKVNLDKQKFEFVKKDIQQSELFLIQAQEILQHIRKVQDDILEAKEYINKNFKNVNSLYLKVKEKAKHSDVKNSTKNKVAEAESLVKKALSYQETENPLIGFLVISGCITALTGIINQSDRDIEEQEELRRKEERKKEEEEESSRKSVYAPSYSNYGSSSSSDDDNNSTFGGGDFGGGGSQGSW